MLATRALRRVGTARAFSTTTSTTARAAAARAALARASTPAHRAGAREWTAAADAARARATRWKARAAATTAPVRARLALAAPRLRLRELLAAAARCPLAARRPRRLARLKAAAAAHTAAVKERARRAAALAVHVRARAPATRGQLAGAWRTYGWTAVGTHFAVYGTTLAGLTAAVDVGLLGGGRARARRWRLSARAFAPVVNARAVVEGGLRSSPTAGAFAVAWVLAKFTEIPRLAVTLALTPHGVGGCARTVRRHGWRCGRRARARAVTAETKRRQGAPVVQRAAATSVVPVRFRSGAQGSARRPPRAGEAHGAEERVDLARRQPARRRRAGRPRASGPSRTRWSAVTFKSARAASRRIWRLRPSAMVTSSVACVVVG